MAQSEIDWRWQMSKSNVEYVDKIHVLICKLKCLSYFVETHNPNCVRPLDFVEVQYGYSLIMNEIIEELELIKDDFDSE